MSGPRLLHDGYLADPFLFAAEGRYVVYGTADPALGLGSAIALASDDLEDWTELGPVLSGVPEALGRDVWAPEVAAADGAYWMYYSVGRDVAGHHIRVARADRPEGPFRDLGLSLTPGESFAIDASPFRDRDGVACDIETVFGYFPILRERAAQDAGLLSGGQQQMLAISRAIMAAPQLILLDEPSLGLSPKLTKEIFEIVVRINRECGTTILLVEQNANMALNAADYGYVLENGRIVMEDSCERLREKDDIKEFYLGLQDDGVRGERRWKKKKTWR